MEHTRTVNGGMATVAIQLLQPLTTGTLCCQRKTTLTHVHTYNLLYLVCTNMTHGFAVTIRWGLLIYKTKTKVLQILKKANNFNCVLRLQQNEI